MRAGHYPGQLLITVPYSTAQPGFFPDGLLRDSNKGPPDLKPSTLTSEPVLWYI